LSTFSHLQPGANSGLRDSDAFEVLREVCHSTSLRASSGTATSAWPRSTGSRASHQRRC